MNWKTETTLGDLPPGEKLEIVRNGRVILRTTPADLMREGRLPAYFTVDQVEFAFSTDRTVSASKPRAHSAKM